MDNLSSKHQPESSRIRIAPAGSGNSDTAVPAPGGMLKQIEGPATTRCPGELELCSEIVPQLPSPDGTLKGRVARGAHLCMDPAQQKG